MTTESEALDRIEELVASRYPKGTEDPLGKALRHQLHRAGRLNVPKHTLVGSIVIGFTDADGQYRDLSKAHDLLTQYGYAVLLRDSYAVGQGGERGVHVNSFGYDPATGTTFAGPFGRGTEDFKRSLTDFIEVGTL